MSVGIHVHIHSHMCFWEFSGITRRLIDYSKYHKEGEDGSQRAFSDVYVPLGSGTHTNPTTCIYFCFLTSLHAAKHLISHPSSLRPDKEVDLLQVPQEALEEWGQVTKTWDEF